MIKVIVLLVFMVLFNLQSYSYASGSLGPYSSQFWKDAANGDYNKSMKVKYNDFTYLVSPVNSIFDISIGDNFDDIIATYQNSPYNERWVVSTSRPNAGPMGYMKLSPELDPVESGYYYQEEIAIQGSKIDNTISYIKTEERYRISFNNYSYFDKRANALIETANKIYGNPIKKIENVTTWEKDGIAISIFASHQKDGNGFSNIIISRYKIFKK